MNENFCSVILFLPLIMEESGQEFIDLELLQVVALIKKL
jgi:hypothetical protein